MALNPLQDGVTHINIYSKAQTALGRALTNMCLFTFEYDGLTFHSVEQAWHYYKFLTKNPIVAKAVLEMSDPYAIKKYVKPYNNEFISDYVQSDTFKSIIKDVIITRLKADEILSLNLRNSYLPFEHYYVFGNSKQGFKTVDESDKYSWLLDIFKDYRTELWLEYLDELLLKHGGLCYNKATAPANAIYVGRGSKFKTITFGNPFPVLDTVKAVKKTNRVYFDEEVAHSVIKFRAHLVNELRKNPLTWYEALVSLQNNSLQCFCNNGKDSRLKGGGFCHSLVLAHFAENVDIIYKQTGLMNNGNVRKNCRD